MSMEEVTGQCPRRKGRSSEKSGHRLIQLVIGALADVVEPDVTLLIEHVCAGANRRVHPVSEKS